MRQPLASLTPMMFSKSYFPLSSARRLHQVGGGQRWTRESSRIWSLSPALRRSFWPQGVLVTTPNTWTATLPSRSRGRST